MYRALHVTEAPETLQAMFHPRSAVSERLMRATAAGTAVLSSAAIPVSSRCILEWLTAACDWLGIYASVAEAV